MTLYRGMDIGTAKPTQEERGGLPHHLIDVLDPWESASVADYRTQAGAILDDLATRNVAALFVGGTPLYLKALLRGLFQGPAADAGLRRSFEEEADRSGDAALHARLATLDPVSAARLHPNDRRRVIRALEVATLTGRPMSVLQREHGRPAEGVAVFALDRPRAELRERIDRRVVAMFEAGLVDEVRRLLEAPRPIGDVAAQGVGYRETIAFLRGEADLETTIARVQARTRQFAKRQATWFRGLAEVRPLPVPAGEPPEVTAARLIAADQGGPVGVGRDPRRGIGLPDPSKIGYQPARPPLPRVGHGVRDGRRSASHGGGSQPMARGDNRGSTRFLAAMALWPRCSRPGSRRLPRTLGRPRPPYPRRHRESTRRTSAAAPRRSGQSTRRLPAPEAAKPDPVPANPGPPARAARAAPRPASGTPILDPAVRPTAAPGPEPDPDDTLATNGLVSGHVDGGGRVMLNGIGNIFNQSASPAAGSDTATLSSPWTLSNFP